MAIGNVLGLQWMLPNGFDKFFNYIIFSAGFLNISLAFILLRIYSTIGMIWAVFFTEFYVALAILYVTYSKTNLFRMSSSK